MLPMMRSWSFGVEIAFKTISESAKSTAVDIEELRRAFIEFKVRWNEKNWFVGMKKIDLLERSTIMAVERLVGSDENTESAGEYWSGGDISFNLFHSFMFV